MTSDGLVALDQETWSVLAKYNLALATVFGVLALAARVGDAGTLLVVENGAFALLFGAIQSYAWLSR